mgnify:FL=1
MSKEECLIFIQQYIMLEKDGCIAALEDGVCHFFAQPIEVLNAVGSGDPFIAGCAVALCKGKGYY